MPPSDFSEDEYECNLIGELRGHYGPGFPHFKPSRTLEHSVGYDFAIETIYGPFNRPGVFIDDPQLRALIPAQRRAVIPHRYVTALIQCKVPYCVTRRREPQAYIFEHWTQAYYRFDIDHEQNAVLSTTEQQLAGTGIVRYAAPCFYQHSEMESNFVLNLIAQRSHYQSPSRIAGHDLYTYLSPIRPGRAFSEPEDIPPFILWHDLQKRLKHSDKIPFATHIARLWRAVVPVMLDNVSVAASADFLGADMILGSYGTLPLDPFERLDSETTALFAEVESGAAVASVRGYAAILLALGRFFRRTLRASWRVFTEL
jgi:hypothetical protein